MPWLAEQFQFVGDDLVHQDGGRAVLGQHQADLHVPAPFAQVGDGVEASRWVLGVARSAYYAAQRKDERPRAKENARLGEKARELFEASGRTYGSPRLVVALRRAGEPCGRHRVARLMQDAGLRARQKRRFRPRTTGSRHLCPIAPNHLAARMEPPTQPGEVWQADITCVATKEGWLYVGQCCKV